MIAGAMVYAIGSVVMARPYVTSPVMLFVAVPIAAAAGMLLLGVLVLVIAALVGALGSFDLPDFGGRRRRRSHERPASGTSAARRVLMRCGLAPAVAPSAW